MYAKRMQNICTFLHWYSTLGPQEAFLWWEWRGRGGGLSKNVGHHG